MKREAKETELSKEELSTDIFIEMRNKFWEEAAVEPRFLWLSPDDFCELARVLCDYSRYGFYAISPDLDGKTTFMGMEVRARPWVTKGTAYLTFMDLESIEEMTALSPLYSAYDMKTLTNVNGSSEGT